MFFGTTAGASHSQWWHQERESDDIFSPFHTSNLWGRQNEQCVHCIHYTLTSPVTGWVILNILGSTWQDWYSTPHPDAELHLRRTIKLLICRNATYTQKQNLTKGLIWKPGMLWQAISNSLATLGYGRLHTAHILLSIYLFYKLEIDSNNLIIISKRTIICFGTWPFRIFHFIIPTKRKKKTYMQTCETANNSNINLRHRYS